MSHRRQRHLLDPLTRSTCTLIVLVIGALQAPAARAMEGKKLLAVLPLDTVHTKGTVDGDAQASLEEMLRDVATNELEPSGWIVLTGETMLQILTDNGVDPTKCTDESCHLGTARQIGAGVFISGSLQLVDSRLTASIRLIETATGRILSTASIDGKDVIGLRDAFLAQAPAFFARSGLTTPLPVPETTPLPSPGARLAIHVQPEVLARIVVRDPDGNDFAGMSDYENDFAKPGRWTVTASAHGYARESRVIDMVAGEPQSVAIELKQHGSLAVSGLPEGARVDVAGPRDFHSGGVLPWVGAKLRSGFYHVIVSSDGYTPLIRDVIVDPATTTNVDANLQRVIDQVTIRSPREAAKRESSAMSRQVAALSLFGVAGASAGVAVAGLVFASAAKAQADAQTFPIDPTQRQSLISRGQVGNAMAIAGLTTAVVAVVVGAIVYPKGRP